MNNNAKVQKLSQSAKDKICALTSLSAKGDQGAAAELHSTAALATEWLTWQCRKNPALFTGIAQERFSWPIMYNPHRDALKEKAAFIRALKLGTDTHINLSSGKTFSWEVPANVVALNLHRLARALQRAPINQWALRDYMVLGSVGRLTSDLSVSDRKQLKALEEWGQRGAGSLLPPLSKNTAAQWRRATTELFRMVYGENFDEHPDLQELKRSVLLRARDGSGKHGGRGVVRAAMLKAVKQAWPGLAALD
jgi:hypothetical protein